MSTRLKSPIAYRGWCSRTLILDETNAAFEMPYLLRIQGDDRRAVMETTKHEEILVRSQAVVSRVVAGETLLVPVRSKVGDLASIFSFNGTGTLIWKLLESPRTIGQLAMAISETYEVDVPQAENDVAKFVAEMISVGLVEVPARVAMAGD